MSKCGLAKLGFSISDLLVADNQLRAHARIIVPGPLIG